MILDVKNQDNSLSAFVYRHTGPRPDEIDEMLSVIGVESLDELVDQAVPRGIRTNQPLQLKPPFTEREVLAEARRLAGKNQVFRSLIGMGYYDCITPPVIQRTILENPGWYTQYTPYQAEISQGRLEALINFQTVASELAGLSLANASLLDEGTAAAEAMGLAFAAKGSAKKNRFFVSTTCHPQTVDVVRTRADFLGIEVIEGNHDEVELSEEFFGALVQFPATDGEIHNYADFAEKVHGFDALVICAADLLSLTLLTPPGEWGADVAVGSTQRFGVPMGFGGPHAAYFATRDEYKRLLPGRLVGVSKDTQGRPAYRLSLQTREQHIRRDRATSNICTAQVLLAIMASMYAVYHGPEGLKEIANRIHSLTVALARGLARRGVEVLNEQFFDTLRLRVKNADAILSRAKEAKINLRAYEDGTLGLSLDEVSNEAEVARLISIISGMESGTSVERLGSGSAEYPPEFVRKSAYLTHPVFNSYRSETELLRYVTRLQSRDLSLTTSMIPLGSCTMKLNAAAEMLPISWPEWSSLHPFAPIEQVEGYRDLCNEVEEILCEVTGMTKVSLQPNSGAQGEFAGLLAIANFHRARGETGRRICLIPQSAHGTNPASAAMAGMKVVAVKCAENGDVDLEDLKAKAENHAEQLAALMVTYPSTHGVFEEAIRDICQIIHDNGGLVYMDGANMNALVGICRPADFGVDVCHLNLHKTFAIPHGGGGPGIGPIAVVPRLEPYLPGHRYHPDRELEGGAVASAPWGSANVLLISWAYMRLMGAEGLTYATKIAILNANYIASRLDAHFPILYKGANGKVAHECILDCRHFKRTVGITVSDVAKRLMDYVFHAPTISWPVVETVMVEPTESESKQELDRFCDAMIGIRNEIHEIEKGQSDANDNVLRNAPHTAEMVTADDWSHPYSRQKAAFPVPSVRTQKFWTYCGRIDDTYGDRHLFCACVPVEGFHDEDQ
ncbi:MAG: aminomethyl-transferring glycine dehydrogenase [Acidobacteriota bacterium]|nr:MAG: aminomethyl-transferring glycine dehydrogenase [Acidobacteriota bacterium]